MNVQEFKDKYFDSDGDLDSSELHLIEEGDTICEYKTCYTEYVYRAGDCEDYFRVRFVNSNSGHWSDGESYEPEVEKVVPIIIKKTDWQVVK